MVCIAFFIAGCQKESGFHPPINLQCEHVFHPLGIDVSAPRFSWEVNDIRRGAVQTAYQVRVATDNKFHSRQMVWNSGKILSGQSILVVYAGLALQGCTRYYWQVKTWDGDGHSSGFSEPSWFETGILDPDSWKAKWIGKGMGKVTPHDFLFDSWIWHPSKQSSAPVYFVKEFDCPPGVPISIARAGLTADYEYTLYINGKKIGSATQWDKIHVYDILSAVKPGENLVAIEASANNPSTMGLLADIQIYFDSGDCMEIGTDASWKVSDKPGRAWNQPGFDAGEWPDAAPVAHFGKGYWGNISYDRAPLRSVMMRKEIEIPKKISQARVYVTGLGSYVMYINGRPVSDDILSPGWTHYLKRVQYQVYDVTALLQQGKNALAAILGNGWWTSGMGWSGGYSYSQGPLRFYMQMVVTYADGRTETFTTDESWKTADSPILANTIYDGETYDARLEQAGWKEPGFHDQSWDKVLVLPDLPVILSAEYGPPIRVTEELAPIGFTQPKPGVYVFDMGQNMVGKVKIMASGQAGDSVTLRFAERLNDDGTIYTANLRLAKATDRYIFRGDSVEVWEPLFTYHGFRYVEMTHCPSTPRQDILIGRVFHTDAMFTGAFACSNDLLNTVQQNITWGLRGNMHSVPTDCPQRDERLGWMGDAQAVSATACYNIDLAAFFRKWLRDIRDSQNESGYVHNVNPTLVVMGPGSPAWADALVIIPWELFRFYGDTAILRENFDAMLALVRYMQKMSKDSIYEYGAGDWGGYGDWIAVVPSPTKPTGPLYYYHSTDLLSRMADIIGESSTAAELRKMLPGIARAYNKKYFDPGTGWYIGKTQTMNILPLAFHMVPENERSLVIGNVVDDIKAHNNHLSTGFLGTRYICPVLSDYGFHDIAYQLAVQNTYPSWGYMVEKGATTIWELWNGDTGDPGMNSLNHYALGSVGEWYYAYLAGIRTDPAAPGFRHFFIEPRPVGDLTWADGSVLSPYGMINCHWELEAETLTLLVTVPANTHALVKIPSLGKKAPSLSEGETMIVENGREIKKIDGVGFIGIENGKICLAIGSGDYQFILK